MGSRQQHQQQATAAAVAPTMTIRGSNDFGVGGQPQQALFC